jgi:hypothetical protein
MTTIQIETEHVTALRDAALAANRPPDQVTAYSADDPSLGELTWNTDLSAAELAAVERFRRRLRSGLRVTDAEWSALAPDLDGLRTYVGIATPTAAQTAQATKAIIRVLRAIIRD